MPNLLKILMIASERAACIARSCQNTNESLLVAEKGGAEANPRFNKDFKTIADVLAQECAKAYIVSQVPELKDQVRGEESSEIGGVNISVKESLEETMNLLSSILPHENAKCMAEAAHSEIDEKFLSRDYIPEIPNLDFSNLAIWIDPIDGTAEFISGLRGEAEHDCGLPCVTVLIGAYLKSTGKPVIGVINQPFYNDGNGRIVWGVVYGTTYLSSHENMGNDNRIILMSNAENQKIMNKFKKNGWKIQNIPGAGHKLLKVALGEASAYIVSKGTTFRWDTCAPHAIIAAKGGDVVSFKDFTPIKYNDPQNLATDEYCNKNGIIAFTNAAVYSDILDVIQE